MLAKLLQQKSDVLYTSSGVLFHFPSKLCKVQASMTFFDTKDFPDVESLTWYGRLAEWLQSSSFEGIIAVALLANVLWMAVSLQVNGGKTGNELGIINDEKVTADSDEWKILTQAPRKMPWKNGLDDQGGVSMTNLNGTYHRYGKVSP